MLGLFGLIVIGLFIYARTSSTDAGNARVVSSVHCDANEQLAYHIHAHLDILKPDGQPVVIPQQIGFKTTCLYWTHTHDTSGIIHIEAPADQKNRTFTLGDFFSVWGQPLDSKHVATFALSGNQKVVAYVDGKPYTGEPKNIPLKAHAVITLEVTPPVVDPPPKFDFPQGL